MPSIGGESSSFHVERGTRWLCYHRQMNTSIINISNNDLVAIVGGGGKSSLMFALANSLSDSRVVTTTTTRIFAAQMSIAPATCFYDEKDEETFFAAISDALDAHGQCLVVGSVGAGSNVEKAFGVPPSLPARLLARVDVNIVLVEADGSRMRPIKAPADHEPVIPTETTLVVPVVGIDAINGRLSTIAHRPEKMIALGISDRPGGLQATDIARLLAHPDGGLKGVPDGARVVPLLNKVETAVQRTIAHEIAQLALQQSPRLEKVIIGAVQGGGRWEACGRVTAVILAAGKSSRMGVPKLSLAWGDGTILEQTIRHSQASLAHDLLVVTGHGAAAVAAMAARQSVATVHNIAHAEGEMIVSLQTAVSHLPENIDGILVILGDQPLVETAVLNQLMHAFWHGDGNIIAPMFAGRRGNPVLIARTHFAELLALPPDAAPRYLLRNHPVAHIAVGSDSILKDVDDRENYERLRPKE